MKKTISVNIGGFIFNIEEEAYELMLGYLDNLKNHLKKTEGGEEIFQDIESRIAELFQEKISLSKEVVIVEDVESVIEIIGKPEEYLFDDDDEKENEDKEDSKKEEESYQGERRVYRDKDHAVVGGVCSGVARYFDIDPIIIRAIFAVLLFGFGTGLWLYIILWIIIPEAKTNTDRLKMRGRKVNVENLKEQFQKVKENPKRNKEINRVGNFIREIASKFFKSFGKVLGIGIVLFSIFFFIFFFSFSIGGFGLFTDENGVNSIALIDFSNLIFRSGFQSVFAWVGIGLLTLIPILGLLTFGIQLLFKLRSKYTKIVAITLGFLWAIGFGIMTIIGMQLASDFAYKAEFEDQVYQVENTDEIFIDVAEDAYFSNRIDYEDFEMMEMIQIHDEELFLGYPELTIHQSPDTNYHIIVIYSSRGTSHKAALRKAENIDYKIKRDGNEFIFSPYFKIQTEDKFRGQMVEIIVQVPDGKRICFGKNPTRILNSTVSERDVESDKTNKTFEMREKKLIISR